MNLSRQDREAGRGVAATRQAPCHNAVGIIKPTHITPDSTWSVFDIF
ncbi:MULTISPECIES: hypothetical protein [Microvirgula]|nr:MULTISPECIES: hypothetical protein [Microvirgula]